MPMLRSLSVAALVIAVACGGSSTGYGNPPPAPPPPPPPPPGGHSTTITVANNSFSPTPDTVSAGTITFQWAANAVIHNVTWQTGPAPLPTNSGNKGASETYPATLQQGTYTYHCTIHSASGMSGVIVVLP